MWIVVDVMMGDVWEMWEMKGGNSVNFGCG